MMGSAKYTTKLLGSPAPVSIPRLFRNDRRLSLAFHLHGYEMSSAPSLAF